MASEFEFVVIRFPRAGRVVSFKDAEVIAHDE
jgi:hypothetical protein